MSNENNQNTYEYQSMFGTYQLQPRINTYADNNNLYLGFNCYDEEFACWEPYCDATVNILPLGYLESAIDTNNNGHKFLEFLEANGFGQRTPYMARSGYCTYPIFRFNEDKLRQIDPAVFANYQKAYGMGKTPLDAQIRDADARPKSGSKEKPEKTPVR